VRQRAATARRRGRPRRNSGENSGLYRGELFDSTVPFGDPQLPKASTYRQFLDELDALGGSAGIGSRHSLLSPSLQADLQISERQDGNSEVVEAFAACVRHSTRVTMHLHCAERVLALTVFPQEHLLHCPMDMDEFVARQLPFVSVMHLEPALLRPPGYRLKSMIGQAHLYHPLAPFLWTLAMYGPRQQLLPPIRGPAVYRVAPSLTLAALPVLGVTRSAIDRMRLQAVPLSAIASWPGFDRERAIRLLNALYLQTGLMVSRSHPDAVRESWFN
jgi:hypothetical protein